MPLGVVTLIVTASPGSQSLKPKSVMVASNELRIVTEFSPAMLQTLLLSFVKSIVAAETTLPVGMLLLLEVLPSVIVTLIPPVDRSDS